MKKLWMAFACTLAIQSAIAQQGLLGIQNSSRKGMVHANMNPAEINNFTKKVELNLFSIGAAVSNSTLSYRDFLDSEGDDLLESSLRRYNDPLNVYADLQVLGPGLAFQADKWAFGISTRTTLFANVSNLNNSLGRGIFEIDEASASYQLFDTGVQHVSIAGWSDIGLTIGREVYSSDKHKVTVGGAIRGLMPMTYSHMGIKNLQGRLEVDNSGAYLTDAQGEFTFEYADNEGEELGEMMASSFSLSNIQGTAFDFGMTHTYKRNGRAFISSGISVRNMGKFPLDGRVRRSHFSFNIADREVFDLNTFEGNAREIEEELSRHANFQRRTGLGNAVKLPGIINLYTNISFTKVLHVSLMMQRNLTAGPIQGQNIMAVTPKLNLGFLELYSPWINSEIGGVSGGLGLRLGSLYVGSQSILSAAFSDTRQLDAHVGWSWGFGKRSKVNKYIETD